MMRCHNLVGAAATGLKDAWNYLTSSRGCLPNMISLITSMALCLILTVSFYYRHIRRGPASPGSTKKPPLQFLPALDCFPYEPVILFLYASTSWLGHAGLTVLSAFLNNESRAKMWEGMDIFGGLGRESLFWIVYFVFFESLEGVMMRKHVVGKYMAAKNKSAMLPVMEEKEIVRESIDEKEVSIYEAIAQPPTPAESKSLLADSESNTVITPRPSFWQRIKLCFAKPPALTAENVLGRYYIMAFFKCNIMLFFAMLANTTICGLSSEQYFDGKSGEFPFTLAGCVLWTTSSGRLLVQGMRFARAELKEQRITERNMDMFAA